MLYRYVQAFLMVAAAAPAFVATAACTYKESEGPTPSGRGKADVVDSEGALVAKTPLIWLSINGCTITLVFLTMCR